MNEKNMLDLLSPEKIKIHFNGSAISKNRKQVASIRRVLLLWDTTAGLDDVKQSNNRPAVLRRPQIEYDSSYWLYRLDTQGKSLVDQSHMIDMIQKLSETCSLTF